MGCHYCPNVPGARKENFYALTHGSVNSICNVTNHLNSWFSAKLSLKFGFSGGFKRQPITGDGIIVFDVHRMFMFSFVTAPRLLRWWGCTRWDKPREQSQLRLEPAVLSHTHENGISAKNPASNQWANTQSTLKSFLLIQQTRRCWRSEEFRQILTDRRLHTDVTNTLKISQPLLLTMSVTPNSHTSHHRVVVNEKATAEPETIRNRRNGYERKKAASIASRAV